MNKLQTQIKARLVGNDIMIDNFDDILRELKPAIKKAFKIKSNKLRILRKCCKKFMKQAIKRYMETANDL